MSTPRHYEFRLTNSLAELQPLAERVNEMAAELALPEDVRYAIDLAVDEIVTNVIKYAYVDDGAEAHEIRVGFAVAEDEMQMQVEDEGSAFDPFQQGKPEHLTLGMEERPIGGLGLHLLRAMMDGCAYDREGDVNRVTFKKKIKRPDATRI